MTVIVGPWPGSGDDRPPNDQPAPLGLPLGHDVTLPGGDIAGGWCHGTQLDALVVGGVCSACGYPVGWDDGTADG